MLPSFASKTATIYRAPLVDSRGTKVRDWASQYVTKTDVAGCSFQPVSSDTRWTDPSQAVTSTHRLFMPPGTDVKASDRVEVDSTMYAIQGEPSVWESPTGAVSHIVVDLREWSL